jgi:hypothetical protein
MKPLLHLTLFIFMGVMCHAQVRRTATTEPVNAIKFNLVSPFLGSISLSCERSLNQNASIIATANFFTGKLNGKTYPERGFGVCAEYRLYCEDKYMSGFYIQPYLRYQHYYNIVTKTDQLSVPGGGILFGYQSILLRRLILDLNFGPSYNAGELKSPTGKYTKNDIEPLFNGYWMRAAVTTGILF